MSETRALRLKLSISQVMKLVVYFAFAFACIFPMVDLWKAGFSSRNGRFATTYLIIFELIAVPLVWAGLSLLLIQRGERRDKTVFALLFCSTVIALCVATWVFLRISSDLLSRPSIVQGLIGNLGQLVLIASIVAFLSGSALFLVRKLVRNPQA